jgi:hypothetical protein
VIDTPLSGPVHFNHLLVPLMLAHGQPGVPINVSSGGSSFRGHLRLSTVRASPHPQLRRNAEELAAKYPAADGRIGPFGLPTGRPPMAHPWMSYAMRYFH